MANENKQRTVFQSTLSLSLFLSLCEHQGNNFNILFMHQENPGGAAGNRDLDCVAIWVFICPAMLGPVSAFLEGRGLGLSTGSEVTEEVMLLLKETFVEGIVVVKQTPGALLEYYVVLCIVRNCLTCLHTHTHTIRRCYMRAFRVGSFCQERKSERESRI